MRAEEINSLDSEAGVIATLIHHPEYSFYSEFLLPNHFTDNGNRCVYAAITGLARQGIMNIDPYNIMEFLNASEATRKISSEITVERLQELVEMSDILARQSVEEYKLCVSGVMDAAMRRNTVRQLKKCEELCFDKSVQNLEQRIYDTIDGVVSEFSLASDSPSYLSTIDECWEDIKARQGEGYAGIPFKFPTLNKFATMEKGELFIVAAEAKQGKSMFLLNTAVDLLKRDQSVLYLDSELNDRLFTKRTLAHLSGVEYHSLSAGTYGPGEEDRIEAAKEWLKTKRFEHMYIPYFDQQSIYTTVKKIYHTMGIDVLVVDYFKSSGEGDAFDSYQELGRFVDMVKNQICGDMNIAGVGAAQATATGKVADSAKIGRNASTIAMLQDKTAAEIEADGPECGNKKLRIILNRNGPQHAPGEYIDLAFDGNHILYSEAKQHVPVSPY